MLKVLFFIIAFVLFFTSYGQYRQTRNTISEFGISLNAMNCNTDIEGRINDLKNTRPGVGVYAVLLYHELVGARLEATVGKVTATDARADKVSLKNRNLSFRSSISEVSLFAELHPLNIFYQPGEMPRLSPYLLAGIGYFAFNPQALLQGNWIDLHPLHTEGQGFAETGRPDYKLGGLVIPAGGGLQYKITDRYSLRGEALYRFLKTDYLDDVSTKYINANLFNKYLSADNAVLARALADRSPEIPGNQLHSPGTKRGSQKKDAYYSINIKLGILINEVSKKTIGCYTF